MAKGRQRWAPAALFLASIGPSIGGAGLACNALTGAADLALCEEPSCVDERGADGGSPDGGQGGLPEAASDARIPDGDSGATVVDAAGCSECDGGTCCAPDTCVVATGVCGACSAVGGPCALDSDCCNGICTARGKCATSCKAPSSGPDCFTKPCCLGARCDITTFECVVCGLDGTSCNSSASCCSGKCVGNTCAGNIPSTPGP